MQTTIEKAKRMKLEKFAEEHGLKMSVRERSATHYCFGDFENNRWFASFDNVDVLEPSVLIGAHGNGPTPAKAIRDYAKQISEKNLCVDAFKPTRKEIYAPILY
jgi:hypothetical protein